MDILFVIGQLDRGGTENQLLQLLPVLKGSGLMVELYAFRTDGELAVEFERHGVQVSGPNWQPKGWLGLISTAVSFYRFLWRRRPRIVHFFLPEAYLLGGCCSVFAPKCVRVMSRRSLRNYQKRRPVYGWVESLLHPVLDKVFVNSSAIRAEVLDEGIAEDKVHLIHNGVVSFKATARMRRSTMRQILQIPDDAVIFVMVANLLRYKGHSDLFRALQKASPAFVRDWRLLLVGADSGIGSELRALVGELGLEGKTVWIGGVPSVYEYITAADIGILTSHEEGFSNAILEYMAVGLPVIATDVGGNGEAVIDYETGLLVPTGDQEQLATALITLTNDARVRARFGAAGRVRVLKMFSMESCAQAYRNVYGELLSDI